MRRLALALCGLALLGCGDSSGPGGSSAVGRWTLTTVNGASLPLVIDEDPATGYTEELLADEFDIHADGTFDQTTTFRETQNGTVTTYTFPDAGTWTQTNASLRITFDDGTGVTLGVSGNTATYAEPGIVFVYQRL